jgi:FMN reductase
LKKLRAIIKESDGIILATPEYHNSFSGVLKNALDLMGFEQFEGKTIGLIGVSGGSMGANQALSSLRNIGRALHAWVIPQEASIPNVWKVFDESGKCIDDTLVPRIKSVGLNVAKFALMHNDCAYNHFIDEFLTGVENPGGKNHCG